MHNASADSQRIIVFKLHFCIEKYPKKALFMQFVLTKICRVIAEYVSLSVNYT